MDELNKVSDHTIKFNRLIKLIDFYDQVNNIEITLMYAINNQIKTEARSKSIKQGNEHKKQRRTLNTIVKFFSIWKKIIGLLEHFNTMTSDTRSRWIKEKKSKY